MPQPPINLDHSFHSTELNHYQVNVPFFWKYIVGKLNKKWKSCVFIKIPYKGTFFSLSSSWKISQSKAADKFWWWNIFHFFLHNAIEKHGASKAAVIESYSSYSSVTNWHHFPFNFIWQASVICGKSVLINMQKLKYMILRQNQKSLVPRKFPRIRKFKSDHEPLAFMEIGSLCVNIKNCVHSVHV